MGPQPSTLNCQTNGLNEKNQGTINKESLEKQITVKQPTEQSDKFSLNLHIQHALVNKSPLGNLKLAPSEKNILNKSTKKPIEQKIFIPQHQSLTKVSETPFKSSLKQKKFYVQDHAKSLAEIIQPRYNTMKHFPYSQILGLTESLVYGLAYMTKKNCNHHDFYPTNIYYSEGKFKVINPLEIQASGFYLTSQSNLFFQTKQGQRFSFLSPQLIIAILEEVTQNEIGKETLGKADVFAIGMILLEITCLQPSSQCYDSQSYNIVDSIIGQRLQKVSKVYTPVMAECINLMLQYEVEKRIDPLTLGQLIHWKIENQKLVAMQMQAPKSQGPVPQQMVPGMRNTMPPPPQGTIPPNMIPQQMRGPPPSPYSHQSFKMQNLNQNVIAVTVPDEQFTRISPNNQGFLSSSSLQQKLRVIELIKQHPEQDEDVIDCESKYEESEQNDQDHQKSVQVKVNMNSLQNRINTQNVVTKPQYPFVESIYSQKPLLTPTAGYEQQKTSNIPKDPLVMRENKQYLTTQSEFKAKMNEKNLLQVPGMHNPSVPLYQPVYQYQQLQERKGIPKKQIKNEQRQQRALQRFDEILAESHSTQDLSGSTGSSTYEQKAKPISGNNFTAQTLAYESGESKMTDPPLQYQPLQRGKAQTPTYITSFSYGNTLNSAKGSPSVKGSILTDNQLNNLTQKINPITVNQSYKKYGTSFQSTQGESIEQRVQRVLNMSRNTR